MSDTPVCSYCLEKIPVTIPGGVLVPFGMYHEDCYVQRTTKLLEACSEAEGEDTHVRETRPSLKIYRVYYKIPINGVYDTSENYCHVTADSEEGAKVEVGNMIEKSMPMLDKLGLIFTSIQEENYVWLDEVISKYDDLDILRKELRSAALGAYVSYFHAESQTHILYVPWFKPLIVRGVAEEVHTAHDILKEGVETLLTGASFSELNRWKHQYRDWCVERG